MLLQLQQLLACQKIPPVFLSHLLSRSCSSFFMMFSFYPPRIHAAVLPGVVPLQSQFNTKKHLTAGSNSPDIWLAQCSHQNLPHLTLTSNGGQICLLITSDQGFMQQTHVSYGVLFRISGTTLIPSSKLLQILDCDFNLLTTQLTDSDRKRSKHIRLERQGQFRQQAE